MVTRRTRLPLVCTMVGSPSLPASSRDEVAAMLLYSCASASMLLVNKVCLEALPAPGLLSVVQFAFSAVFIMGMKLSGVAVVDDFEWRKVRMYLLYVAQFVAGIYTNMKALQYSNVDTVIVFRATCPLLVCVLEWAFLGRELPSARPALSLLVVVAGAAGYVNADTAFRLMGVKAYRWVVAYTVVTATSMAYGKVLVGPDMKFLTMWGPTQYTNVLSILPMLAIALLSDELAKVETVVWTAKSVLLLLASCVVGLAISFGGWWCRSLVTATCFTVLGVANKMATVLVNMVVWDQHASATGVLWLSVCLLGAAAYQQAPMRDEEVEDAEEAELVCKEGPLFGTRCR